jgi:hypothetical protein
MYLVNSLKALGRGGGAADDVAAEEDHSQKVSRGIIDEFEQDSDFTSLPEEDQDRTVSAYERAVERGLLVPPQGLLDPPLPPRGSSAASSPAPAAAAASSALRVVAPWGREAATQLPPLDAPSLKVLDWSHHVGRLGDALRWCDAYRAEKLALACADDKKLCGYEPALSSLATTLAFRVRAVATGDAAVGYAKCRERVACAGKLEQPLVAELESLRAVVAIHEEEWHASAGGGGAAAGAGPWDDHGEPAEGAGALLGARRQLAHSLDQALAANREGFDACRAARVAVGDAAAALAAASLSCAVRFAKAGAS